MKRIKLMANWAQWWRRLAIGSVFTMTVAAPAVAFADTATDPEGAPPPDMSATCGCMMRDQELSSNAIRAARRQEIRQAADQDHAQSSYQLGSRPPDWYAPSRPFSQAHFQLGSGHQD